MTADCASASPKLPATSASNAAAQSGALNVARFIIDPPADGSCASTPDGSDRGRAVTTSVILHRIREVRNTAIPPLETAPRLVPREGESPVLRAFPPIGPRDRLAETARLGAMRAHRPCSGNAIRICIALSFFYIGLWGVAPLRAAPAPSTPGDSAALAGQVIASETRAPIGGATVQMMGTRLMTTTDSAGRFALTGLPPGVVMLAVRASGYARGTWRVTLKPGKLIDHRFDLDLLAYDPPGRGLE